MSYEVWGIPPGKRKVVFHREFPADLWQWAEKQGQRLREQGWLKVQVRQRKAKKKQRGLDNSEL